MNSICFFLLYLMTSVACITFVLESTSLRSVLIPDHLAGPWSTAWVLSLLSTEMGPLSPWESLAEWSNKCINAKPAWRGHHHLPRLLPTVQSFVLFFPGQSMPSPPPHYPFCVKSKHMLGLWPRHGPRTLQEAPDRLDPHHLLNVKK